MFGYIRPHKAELLVREFEQYKAVYCSLCRALGKQYGAVSKLSLSYDCTFYALVLLAQTSVCPGFKRKRCTVNPLKGCPYCTGGADAFAQAASLSVIMTYWKLRDDLADSRLFGKLRALLVMPFAAAAHRKAMRRAPELEAIVSAAMQKQREAEQAETPSLDACAEPTAQMLAALFEQTAQTDAEQRVYRQFGYFLGRWVYLMDAADDLEQDRKIGAFNPFLQRFAIAEDPSPERLKEIRTECNQVLNHSLWQAVSAMQLMEFPQFGSIIENIVAKGLPEMQRVILFTENKKKGKSNVGSV